MCANEFDPPAADFKHVFRDVVAKHESCFRDAVRELDNGMLSLYLPTNLAMPDADPFLEQVLRTKADAEVRAAQEVAAHEQGLRPIRRRRGPGDRLTLFLATAGPDAAA